MKVAILGSGGREHTLAWKIKQSPLCESLYVLPGNPGTKSIANNINVSVDDFVGIKKVILDKKIDLLVVGPEVPLVLGLADFLEDDENTRYVKVIGPKKTGALLEGSKSFAKTFMKKYDIPTAAYKSFNADTIEEAKNYLTTLTAPYVIKADGLAAGKGVIICHDIQEAYDGLELILVQKKFGEASTEVVIEEYLDGIEVSCFLLTDGKDYVLLPEAKDYKRINDNDKGPNTGGMGAVSPVPFFDANLENKVIKTIVEPTIEGLKKEGIPYIGFIFIGLMIVDMEPYVIEYNVRMGDPETQAVIPRIKNDLLEMFVMASKQSLNDIQIELTDDKAITIVLASGGYPEKFMKGHPIRGIDQYNEDYCTKEDVIIFHAATQQKDDVFTNNGGRVLAITQMGDNYVETIEKAYKHAKNIFWKDVHFRKDIGKDILKYLN